MKSSGASFLRYIQYAVQYVVESVREMSAAEASGANIRVVESTDAVHFHVWTTSRFAFYSIPKYTRAPYVRCSVDHDSSDCKIWTRRRAGDGVLRA